MTKKKRMFVGSVGTLVKPIILSGILVLAVVVLSMFTRIVYFNGLITVTLANARFVLHLLNPSPYFLFYAKFSCIKLDSFS